MAIKAGWYKVWVEYSYDQVDWWGDYSILVPLNITDMSGLGDLNNTQTGALTTWGQTVLENTNISGLSVVFPYGFNHTNSSLTPSQIESARVNIINAAGVANVNISAPSTFNVTFPTQSNIYIRMWLDSDKTKLYHAGQISTSGGGVNQTHYYWPRYWNYSDDVEWLIPAVTVSTNLTTAKYSWLYGYCRNKSVTGIIGFATGYTNNNLLQIFDDVEPVIIDNDPYAPGGHSEIGGGGGTFDDDSDVISDSSLPTVSFADTGFTRIYNPTLSQLNSLANYLWTDQTFLQTVINHLKQLLENPMDAVISLSLVPCSVPNGAAESVKVMFIDTGVSMNPATTQFVDVDCGTLDVEEYYGSALDYNPYTKIHAYLPYIGQVTLDTDEVMGRTLQVKYRIDIVTGMCAAKILVDQNVLYQFSGHCAVNMPINSADFSSYIGAAMTAGKMVAGVVAGAAGAPAVAAGLIGGPSPSSSLSTTQTNTDRRSPEGELLGTTDTTTVHTNRTSGMTMGEMAGRAISNTVSSVMSSKMTVEHAGGFSGNSGYLAVRRPYLIIERPRMCNPEEYGKYNGRPSMIYLNLGELTGYTEVQNIQLTGFTATNPEMSEIAQLLKSGVIL